MALYSSSAELLQNYSPASVGVADSGQMPFPNSTLCLEKKVFFPLLFTFLPPIHISWSSFKDSYMPLWTLGKDL